mmetsp:Transcript_29692/g.77881  ORF Transcript_29692/g.77881 Transcript_29692/m.77881 type:complete len:259 (-) Transcript_29692:1642-2418(-)
MNRLAGDGMAADRGKAQRRGSSQKGEGEGGTAQGCPGRSARTEGPSQRHCATRARVGTKLGAGVGVKRMVVTGPQCVLARNHRPGPVRHGGLRFLRVDREMHWGWCPGCQHHLVKGHKVDLRRRLPRHFGPREVNLDYRPPGTGTRVGHRHGNRNRTVAPFCRRDAAEGEGCVVRQSETDAVLDILRIHVAVGPPEPDLQVEAEERCRQVFRHAVKPGLLVERDGKSRRWVHVANHHIHNAGARLLPAIRRPQDGIGL